MSTIPKPVEPNVGAGVLGWHSHDRAAENATSGEPQLLGCRGWIVHVNDIAEASSSDDFFGELPVMPAGYSSPGHRRGPGSALVSTREGFKSIWLLS